MEICEIFKEALQENDENRRQTLIFGACRRLSRILPFPSVLKMLQQKQNILKYLLISSQLYENSALLLFYALQDRYYDDSDYVKMYFSCVTKCLINQEIFCQCVIENETKLRWFLLDNSKIFIKKIQSTFLNDEMICTLINDFYKCFIKYNSNFDMLNQCFQHALIMRENWIKLRDIDVMFEIDVEDQLVAISQVMSTKNLDFISDKVEQKREEASNYGLSKREMKQQMLEEWLFYPSEVPLLVANHATVDQLSSEIFKSNMLLDLLLSFILFPTRNPQVVPNKLYNIDVDLNPPEPPSFRKLNVNISKEKRPLLQFRAFRTMQALTDNRNNFLLTRCNKEYYQRAYSLIYECLKSDLVAITICPEIIVQYLSFLLYQEPEISVFFLIFYNIPFRLLLCLDIPEVSQYFTQLISFITTPYCKFTVDSAKLIWKYFEITGFFEDFMNITLFDQKTIDKVICEKSTEFYRPPKFEELLKKPDFAPLEVERQFPQPEQKKVAEEIDGIDVDFDLIFSYLPGKCQKTIKLLEKMIDQASAKKKVTKTKQRMTVSTNVPTFVQTKNLSPKPDGQITFSPTRRRTILAPKLASILDGSLRNSLVVNPIEFDITPQLTQNSSTRSQLQALTNPTNLFGVLTESVASVTKRSVQEIVQKPMYQRMLVKRPTQMIMIHSRSLSNQQKRQSQQSSQINITDFSNKSRMQNSMILNKYSHLIGNIRITEIDKDFLIYPPELKDQQIHDFEKPVFDEEFINQCKVNEHYTKGLLKVLQDILCMIFAPQKFIFNKIDRQYYMQVLMGNNIEKFINLIAKNYLLKQMINEDYDCTFIIAGKIYNLFLLHYDKQYGLSFSEHLNLICKLLLTQLIFPKLLARTILLLESFTLILENTKAKYLLSIPITFWHLLIESYATFHQNSIYINQFKRIFTILFIYGSSIIYTRILLKINCLSYLKESTCNIKTIILILYTMIKVRQDDLKSLKKQITMLASWNAIMENYQNEIKRIDQGFFSDYSFGIRKEDLEHIENLIRTKDTKKNKFYKP